MTQPPVLLATDARGVATVTLNRPEVGNAYNAAMLDALIQGLTNLATDPAVRCLVIKGAGKHFQAGADIRWLGEVAAYPPPENYAASIATTRAMQLLNEFPKPTIALVHGACFGGGVGIVCCVDVAFATPELPVRHYRNPRRRRPHPDLHPHGQRHRSAPHPPLRPDR